MPRWLRGSDRAATDDNDPAASRDSLSSTDPAGVESLDDWDDDDAEDGDGPSEDLGGQEWVSEPARDGESGETDADAAAGRTDATPSDSMRLSAHTDVARSSTLSRSVGGESDTDDIVLIARNPSGGQGASVSSPATSQQTPPRGSSQPIPIANGRRCGGVLAPDSERENGWEPVEASSLPLREWPSPLANRRAPGVARVDDDDNDGEDDFGSRLSDSEVTIAKRNRR
jgi:hypothetical protein